MSIRFTDETGSPLAWSNHNSVIWADVKQAPAVGDVVDVCRMRGKEEEDETFSLFVLARSWHYRLREPVVTLRCKVISRT